MVDFDRVKSLENRLNIRQFHYTLVRETSNALNKF